MKQNLLSLRARICLLSALLGLMACGGVSAAPLSLGGQAVGSIVTEGPFASSTASTGGVNFWAQWVLNDEQTVLDEGNLRWLQLAGFSKEVPGFVDRPFIDPRGGTALGSETADDEPWYDITGATKGTLSLTGGGDDPWLGDGPYAAWSLGPLSFTADTLVVLVTDWIAKEARVLGGVHWGYSIGVPELKQVSPITVSDLSDSKALRDAFNTALALDFNGWTLVVPEPGSIVLAASAIVLVVGYACSRRRRAA